MTLPRRLLAKIDSYAKAHGETRSGFLAEAARAAMRQAGECLDRARPGPNRRRQRGLPAAAPTPAALACSGIAGQVAILTCRIRPSSGDLKRQAQVLLRVLASSLSPGASGLVRCCPAGSAFIVRAPDMA